LENQVQGINWRAAWGRRFAWVSIQPVGASHGGQVRVFITMSTNPFVVYSIGIRAADEPLW